MRKLLLFMLLLFGLLFTSCSTTVKDKESFLKFTINATNGVEVSGFKDYMNDTPIDKEKFISIEIPDAVIIGGRTYKVVSIGEWAFNGCKSLTSIEIPNSVTEIGKCAFWGCKSLTSIEIPNSVTEIGSAAFKGCTSLTSFEISNSVTKIGWKEFKDCTSLTSIVIPNSVTEIGSSAFEGCTSLTSIVIPNSVTEIGSSAFDDCTSLTSIVVDKDNKVYDSRENCNAIIETASNTLIKGCNNTVIPNSVTKIGRWAFNGCKSLESIEIPNSVTEIGGVAFWGCESLTSIVVDKGNKVYDSRENCNAIIETASNTLIAGCQNTVIPNSVTSIGHGAFSSCTSIEIPNSVTKIGEYAFCSCTRLTSIEIPNSVTEIGEYAFYECESLKTVRVPVSLKGKVLFSSTCEIEYY